MISPVRIAAAIPERFPAAALDAIISAGQDIGIADFMMQMELWFAGRLDAQRLGRALALLLDAQPVLGCRLVTDTRRLFWERLTPSGSGLLRCTADAAQFDAFRNRSIDSRRGPQIEACLLRADGGDRLLVKVSHCVCDAGGLSDVICQLSDIYVRLAQNPGCRSEPNTGGCRGCSQVLRRLPWYSFPALVREFARTTLMTQVPRRTHALQVPHGPRQPCTFVVRHLGTERAAVLQDYARQHGATMNDLMIAAFFRALVTAEPWDGRAALRIQTTVDLRRHYLPAGRAEGICNLSTYEHIRLGRDPGRDLAATLERVAAITRRKKAGLIGLSEIVTVPLAGRAPYDLLVKACAKLLRDRVASGNYPSGLTNLGRIAPAAVWFDAELVRAWVLPPVVFPPVLYIGFSGYAGSLTLSAGVPRAAAGCIENFFSLMLAELPA